MAIRRLIANAIWILVILIVALVIYIITTNGVHYKSGIEFRLNPLTGLYDEQIIKPDTD